MNNDFEKTAEQAAAFQKMWAESWSKMMQSAFTLAPDSAPPDVLRQIRSGIFQALAQSWDEFMRSPEFLERMKQWMDTAITFRKMTNDFLARARSDLQAPSREDIDSIMLSVRHMEKRLLDRVNELAEQLRQLNAQPTDGSGPGRTARTTAPKKRASKRATTRKPRT